jgi:hypothetical protein
MASKVTKRMLPTLNPKYMLFDDFLKEHSRKFKVEILGTTRSKPFKQLLAEFPQIVSQGVLILQYSNWYIDTIYLYNPEAQYVFRNFMFQYYKINYYEEELRRARKKVAKAILKLNPYLDQHND